MPTRSPSSSTTPILERAENAAVYAVTSVVDSSSNRRSRLLQKHSATRRLTDIELSTKPRSVTG